MVPKIVWSLSSLAVAALLALAGCATSPPVAVVPASVAVASRAPVILVSVDGMRPDYLGRGDTPVLDALAARGASASMRPSFPSLTFPNHYTIVTGLRPDRHGIVNNTMEDPAIRGVRFGMSNRDAVEDSLWWYQAEPIWVTAEKAGLATATMFWPGSETAVRGVRPRQWMRFDGAMPEAKRVDQLLAWLDQPARPDFLTLYFDTVDHDGHEFGPVAPETAKAVAAVDAQIGRVIEGLRVRGIDANLVVVADHGMAAVAPERTIRLDTLLPAGSFRLVTGGAVAGLHAVEGQAAALEAALLRPHDHMRCWRREAIPAELHYGRNPRVPPYVCAAESGWMIGTEAPRTDRRLGGMHGYDPADPAMAAMFVAAGPGIEGGVRLPAFDNVDVHPLLLSLLGLPQRDTDGSLETLGAALRGGGGAANAPE